MNSDIPRWFCVIAVYILDDGKDPDKKTWVESLKDPAMLYTPGHIKTGPEVNGKACNLNSTLRALFPAGSEVGLEEVWLAYIVWIHYILHYTVYGCSMWITQHVWCVSLLVENPAQGVAWLHWNWCKLVFCMAALSSCWRLQLICVSAHVALEEVLLSQLLVLLYLRSLWHVT